MTVQITLEGPDGQPVPAKGDADGYLLTKPAVASPDAGTPARTGLAATIELTGTAVDLSTALPDGAEFSNAAWRIIVSPGGAGVYWGPPGNEVIHVEAGNFDAIPSATLANWNAKSDGANVTVHLIGGEDV